MTDNIYRNNVYSKGVEMWHNKGRVGQGDETGMQVYGAMEPVTFEQHPFPPLVVRGKALNSNVIGMVRVEGDKVTLIGTTKDRYKLLQPVEYIAKFDNVIGKPCETLGFLGANADKLFITWKLKAIDVHGDAVELYGLVSLGFDGKYGNHLYVTGVRTICQNTHARAIADATKTENQGFGANSHGAVVTTKHTQVDHLDVLGYWMKFVDEETERQAALTQALFCKMEEKKLTIDDAYGFFAKVHPYPDDPRTYIPAELVSKENTEYANGRADADQNREILMALFTGSEGIGITKTLYGAYNTVTQMQNHHIMAKKNQGVESILIGARGKVMDKAFQIAVESL
jgi:hypothetical protein